MLDNIQSSDILQVIRRIDQGISVSPQERSRKYCLVFEGRHYPPKYLLREANVMVNGVKIWISPKQTNSFLRRRGFTIVIHGGAPHE
jgi:hypothetical protein